MRYDLGFNIYPVETGVKKIAVLRVNAIGDFIFALPALEALRYAYPGTEIVYLGQDWHYDFLSGRPGPVDRVIVVPPARGVGKGEVFEEDARELDRFFTAASEEHFDIAIQMHGGGRFSNLFLKRLNARLTVGMKTPDATALDRWLPYFYWQHEIIRNLEIAGLAGAAPVTLEPRLQITDRDLTDSYQAVPEDGRLVVLHPGASDPRRRWLPEKFASIGDALAAGGANVFVTGIESEREADAAVVASMKAKATNLCGKISLEGLTGLLSRSEVVISNDSGPLHLAAAVGARTVGIYWFGNMINAGPFTRRFHRPSISFRQECPICNRNVLTDPCDHQVSYVAEVSVQDVLASALDLLDTRPEQPTRPLPAPVRGDDPGSFAQYTVSVRLPGLANLVIQENNLPPEANDQLVSLMNEINAGTIRYLTDIRAPDAGDWKRYVAPYLGLSWFQVPWFFAEAYLFRRILEGTGYFVPGPGFHKDPYQYEKRQGLEASRESVHPLAAKLEEWRGRWTAEALTRFLEAALWGNQVDLSMWPTGETGRPSHTSLESARSHLLADDAVAVANTLSSLQGKPGRVDFLVDNAGPELAADLCLVDYLLSCLPQLEVSMHLKAHPTYVSDAMAPDVLQEIAYFREDAAEETRRLGDRLEKALQGGQIRLKENFFWNSPLPAWEIPGPLRQDLFGACLVISKGDANYRRLLGDLHWPFITPVGSLLSYFHTHLLVLRTFKSEVAAGLTPARVADAARKDPQWLTAGRWGIIQFKR